MRVFVTGTGRCGSVSFREACRPITNYTCSHEAPCGLLHWPDQHVAVNPQIRRCIAAIARNHPEALWVHLVREREACVRSLARLDRGGVMRTYAALRPTTVPSMQPADIAEAFYRDETANIEASLEVHVPAERRRMMRLETIKDQWHDFWGWIGAEGDLDASIAAWDVLRNTAAERGEA